MAPRPLKANAGIEVADRDARIGTRALRLGRAIRQGYLQVFGIPDYERYVAVGSVIAALRAKGSPRAGPSRRGNMNAARRSALLTA